MPAPSVLALGAASSSMRPQARRGPSLATARDAVERRLGDAAHRNELLLHAAGEGLYAVDLEGRVILVNPAAARMLGWEPAELLGERIHDLIHHTRADGSPYPFADCPTAGGGSQTAEELFWRRDRTSFPVECTSTPILEGGETIGTAVTFHDITRRLALEDELRQAQSDVKRLLEDERATRLAGQASEARFRDLVQSLDAVVWEADGVAYRTTFVSERVRDILGYEPDAYVADPLFWEKHVHPDDLEHAVAASEVAIRKLRPVDLEYRFLAADGRWLWINDRVQITTDPAGASRRLTGVMIDVSERKRLEEELARRAFEDALTGLPNRALFMDRLAHSLATGRRRRRRAAVLFIDVDGLKLINDTLGHEVGDDVLREIARRLRTTARASDTVARLGGDEFTILVEDLAPGHDIGDLAGRFAASVRAPMTVGDRQMSVTASFGIAMSDRDLRDPDLLVQRADIAMYRAKQGGKDRIVVYEESMTALAWARLDLERDLRRAVERREFRVVYQPIVDAGTGRVVLVEALLRWEHGQRGLLEPGEFIAIAEETGLIEPLGDFVLEEACRQVQAWQRAGAADLAVAVNLSARQFQVPDLVERVSAAVERSGIHPGSLHLEITESAMLAEPDAARLTLLRLRALGIGVVIDDFGTGYSSLGYLRALPLDGLKIDRSFIAGLGENAGDRVIVSAAIAIARAFNLRVTAEGVETEAQLDELRRLDCDLVQGYLVSRPVGPAAIAQMVLDSRSYLPPAEGPFIGLTATVPTAAPSRRRVPAVGSVAVASGTQRGQLELGE